MLVYILATIMSAIFIGIAHHFYIFNKDEYILQNNKFIQKKKINLLFILFAILAILPLALVSSLRVGVGTDYYYTYYPGFLHILDGGDSYEREFIPFFNSLNKFIQLFSDNPQWIFVITSFIYMIFMTFAIIRMSKNWVVSALILFLGNYFFDSLNIVRQACAVSIASCALSYSIDKKYFRTILLAGLSVCFHTSAFILIPIYILCSLRRAEKYGYFVIAALLILTPTYVPLLNFLMDKLNYRAYFETSHSPLVYQFACVYGFLFILFVIYYKRLKDINKYTFGLMCVFTLCVAFSLESVNLTHQSALRLVWWFNWPLIFLIPSFTKINSNKIVSYGFTTILLIVVTYILYDCGIIQGWGEALPYVDIWGHVIY